MSDIASNTFEQPAAEVDPVAAQAAAEVAEKAAAEVAEKAAKHGWVPGAKLNYEEFGGTGQPVWASNAQVYEWTGEEGEVGPANPDLEDQLFNNGLRAEAGQSLEALDIEATLEGPSKFAPILKFEDAGLHPQVLENVNLCKYKRCTIVQAYCIPIILAGHDTVAVAQTGSGKTAAYLVPIISNLMGKAKKLQGPRPDVKSPTYDPRVNRVRAEPLVVVVCPTRELAQQIFDEARRLCYRSMLRPACAYGGVPLSSNIQELGKGCDILIASPGRLGDLMDKPHVLSMKRVKYTVIDEADEMLHPDWEEDMNKIMGGGDSNEDADHAYLMFSATFPKEARALARQYMNQDFMRVRVGRTGSSHKNVTQDVIYVDQDQKQQALYDLLFSMAPARTLIFCNSHFAVEAVDDFLYNRNLPTAFMHGKRTQYEREDAMRSFKSGKTPILISTNIFGRGIDVADVGHVINYDLPSTEHGGITEYVHRIGRTGRIGHVGRATSFYNDRNEDLGSALVSILMETQQNIPDFLEGFKPDGDIPTFEDDVTDDEGDEGYTAAGGAVNDDGGWGAPGGGVPAAAGGGADDGWGSSGASLVDAPALSATGGWGADASVADVKW